MDMPDWTCEAAAKRVAAMSFRHLTPHRPCHAVSGLGAVPQLKQCMHSCATVPASTLELVVPVRPKGHDLFDQQYPG